MIYKLRGPMMCRPMHGTTDVYCKITQTRQGPKFELRMGFEFPGGVPFFNGYVEMCSNVGLSNKPFDENFHENFIEGKGYTLCAAWRKLKVAAETIRDGFWMEA